MKKIQLSNRYIDYFTFNGSLSIYTKDQKAFDTLLKRLWSFAEAADSGLEKVTREFTYVSDPDSKSVTFGHNVSQAVVVLHNYNFITEPEKNEILKCIKVVDSEKKVSGKWKFGELLSRERSVSLEETDEKQPTETTSLLIKK
ncbi:MAG: hypothetical protein K2X50_06960 [Gammaproteobacteria bacterium]|nr:hypothetical protein [Gammaproteobacteria bacterium]